MTYQEACLFLGKNPEPMKRSFDWSKDAGKKRKWQPREIQSPPVEWIRKCSAFVDWTHEQLLKSPQILAYLTTERGLSTETVKSSCLGWNPRNMARERPFWSLPEKTRKDGKTQDIWLPQGIVIPYFTDGVLQRARIRRIDLQGLTPERGPAYCIVSGSTSAAMIPEEPSRVIVVVESEFDAILLQQEIGDLNLAGVVAMGSASTRPDQAAFNLLQQADLILVALDSDDQREDEKNTGAKEAKWWMEHFDRARRLPPVDGKDPGEMWKNGIDLQRWVAVGINKYLPQINIQKKKLSGFSIKSMEEYFMSYYTVKIEDIAREYDNHYSKIKPNAVRLHTSMQDDEDFLMEVWDLCLQGKASVYDFDNALNIWYDGWMEKIKEEVNCNG